MFLFQCHQTRSLTKNRELARELLQQKVDEVINGSNSYLAQVTKEKRDKKLKAKHKTKKKYQLLKTLKESEQSPDPCGVQTGVDIHSNQERTSDSNTGTKDSTDKDSASKQTPE